MSVRSKSTVSRSGCSRRDTLMIFGVGPRARPCQRLADARRRAGDPDDRVGVVAHGDSFHRDPLSNRLDNLSSEQMPIRGRTHERRGDGAGHGRRGRPARGLGRAHGAAARVQRIERMPRWRPAWDIDVEVDGRGAPAPRAGGARAAHRDAVPHRRRGRGRTTSSKRTACPCPTPTGSATTRTRW